jgi:phosphoribosylformylglycinamidine synthase
VTDTKRWVIKATPGYDPLDDAPPKREPQVVVDLPIPSLTDDAPVYDRPRAAQPPAQAESIPICADFGAELLALLGSPNLGSRAWVWRQYDQIVRGGTLVRCGSDAGVVRVPCLKADGTTIMKHLAFAADCNGRYCELDPFEGGKLAVAEVCRNLVCSGAEPIGITDCLNFGNPERPEIMEQFARAIDGLAAACTALGVPIVSGNVSLYNETDKRAILPTPTVAAVGLLASGDDRVTQWFKRAGDAVVLLGEATGQGLGGSEYLTGKSGVLGEPPRIDLEAEGRLQRLILSLARAHVLESAHDVSEGGLAVAIAECCTTSPDAASDHGARIDLQKPRNELDAVALLFGEAPSRVVVSVRPEKLQAVLAAAEEAGVPAAELGVTGGHTLSIAMTITAAFPPVWAEVSEIRRRREACLDSIVGS